MTKPRNWRRSRLLAGALSLTMIAAACGGRDDGDSASDTTSGSGGEEAAGGDSIIDTSICADYQATEGDVYKRQDQRRSDDGSALAGASVPRRSPAPSTAPGG